VLPVDIKGFALAFAIGVFVDGVFEIATVFARMASAEGSAIRQSGGNFEEKGGCSRFATSQNKDFHPVS
jgi:hypothetical protein